MGRTCGPSRDFQALLGDLSSSDTSLGPFLPLGPIFLPNEDKSPNNDPARDECVGNWYAGKCPYLLGCKGYMNSRICVLYSGFCGVCGRFLYIRFRVIFVKLS